MNRTRCKGQSQGDNAREKKRVQSEHERQSEPAGYVPTCCWAVLGAAGPLEWEAGLAGALLVAGAVSREGPQPPRVGPMPAAQADAEDWCGRRWPPPVGCRLGAGMGGAGSMGT